MTLKVKLAILALLGWGVYDDVLSSKAMPTNNTNYSRHIKVVKL